MPVTLETQKKRDERAAIAKLRRETAAKTGVGNVAGQRFVWDVLDRVCGTFGCSYVTGDAQATAFNEGRRSIGVQLMTELQALAPQSYVAMLLEQTQEQNGEALLRASESVPASGDRSGS